MLTHVLIFGIGLLAMCMFDKVHLTFNFKSKVSRDVFINTIKSRLKYTIYYKMSPWFWVQQYLTKLTLWIIKIQS
jgi:hypothetical protein